MRVCPDCNNRYTEDIFFCPKDGQKLIEGLDFPDQGDRLIGRTIENKYYIERKIAEGSMSRVYLATHRQLDTPVAVKVMHERFMADENAVRLFRREAQSAMRIRHTNAIVVMDFGVTEDNVVYLVMEYLQGVSLAERLRETPRLPLATIMEIMQQICAALRVAHRRGITHRDLKPENIYLQQDNDTEIIKVLDFGIAKLDTILSGSVSERQDGVFFGSPKYMAPEQFETGQCDFRSDVYALGIILYQMLTGATPFDAPDLPSLAYKHLSEPPPSILALRPELPEALERLVQRALHKNPDDRPSDAGKFADELNESLPGLGANENSNSEVETPVVPERSISETTELLRLYARPEWAFIDIPTSLRGFTEHWELDVSFFPNLLGQLAQERVTGVSWFNSGMITKGILWHEGRMVFALSDDQTERLGERLVRQGRLHRSQFNEAMRWQYENEYYYSQGRKNITDAFWALNFLSPESLPELVATHVYSICYTLGDWERVIYAFEAIEYQPPFAFDISLTKLTQDIAESVELERLHRFLEGQPGWWRVNPENNLNIGDELNVDTFAIKEALLSPQTISQLVTLTQQSEEIVTRGVAALLALGVVQAVVGDSIQPLAPINPMVWDGLPTEEVPALPSPSLGFAQLEAAIEAAEQQSTPGQAEFTLASPLPTTHESLPPQWSNTEFTPNVAPATNFANPLPTNFTEAPTTNWADSLLTSPAPLLGDTLPPSTAPTWPDFNPLAAQTPLPPSPTAADFSWDNAFSAAINSPAGVNNPASNELSNWTSANADPWNVALPPEPKVADVGWVSTPEPPPPANLPSLPSKTGTTGPIVVANPADWPAELPPIELMPSVVPIKASPVIESPVQKADWEQAKPPAVATPVAEAPLMPPVPPPIPRTTITSPLPLPPPPMAAGISSPIKTAETVATNDFIPLAPPVPPPLPRGATSPLPMPPPPMLSAVPSIPSAGTTTGDFSLQGKEELPLPPVPPPLPIPPLPTPLPKTGSLPPLSMVETTLAKPSALPLPPPIPVVDAAVVSKESLASWSELPNLSRPPVVSAVDSSSETASATGDAVANFGTPPAISAPPLRTTDQLFSEPVIAKSAMEPTAITDSLVGNAAVTNKAVIDLAAADLMAAPLTTASFGSLTDNVSEQSLENIPTNVATADMVSMSAATDGTNVSGAATAANLVTTGVVGASDVDVNDVQAPIRSEAVISETLKDKVIENKVVAEATAPIATHVSPDPATVAATTTTNTDSVTAPTVAASAPAPPPVDYQAMQVFCYEVESTLSIINLADDYYAVLGVSSQVSLPEIQQAYKNLYEKFNPQNHRELIRLVPQLGTQLATIIQQLDSAHKVLSNTDTRSAYNSQLRRKTTRVVESGESNSGKLGTVSGKFRPVTMKSVAVTPNPALESSAKRPVAKPTAPSTTSANPAVSKASGGYVDPSRMRNADDWYLLGLEMLENNDLERAVKAFQQAVRLKPRDAEFHAALARSYEKMYGHNDRTIEEYQAAIELKPKAADYYAELAMFYAKHKYWPEAKQYNEQALQIDGNNRAALRVKQILDKEQPQ